MTDTLNLTLCIVGTEGEARALLAGHVVAHRFVEADVGGPQGTLTFVEVSLDFNPGFNSALPFAVDVVNGWLARELAVEAEDEGADQYPDLSFEDTLWVCP